MSEKSDAGRAALLQILQRMELVAKTNVEVANRIATQQHDLVQGQSLLADAYNQAASQAHTTNALLVKLCEKIDRLGVNCNVLADSLDGVPVLEARAHHGGRSLAGQAIQGLLGGVANSIAPPYRRPPPPPPGWRPPGRHY